MLKPTPVGNRIPNHQGVTHFWTVTRKKPMVINRVREGMLLGEALLEPSAAGVGTIITVTRKKLNETQRCRKASGDRTQG
jgi:hypothetical protein